MLKNASTPTASSSTKVPDTITSASILYHMHATALVSNSSSSSSYSQTSCSSSSSSYSGTGNSSMIIPDETDETAFASMCLDDFFDAICTNDMPAIIAWYHIRPFVIEDFELSGLNLARELGHTDIADIITNQLIASRASRLTWAKGCGPDIHNRTMLSFDDNHYFSSIVLETYTNSAIYLRACYNTDLEYPFLRNPLCHLGALDAPGSLFFMFRMDEMDEVTIFEHFLQVFSILTVIGRKDGARLADDAFILLIEMLQAFFDKWEQGLCTPMLFEDDPNVLLKTNNHSYINLVLNHAATYFEHERMLQLLRDGADPNSRYSGHTLLYIAAVYGTDNIFNKHSQYSIEEGTQRLLTTIKLLLSYGANSALDNYGQTLMQHLVNASGYEKPNILSIYHEIIILLTADPQAKPHITIHPEKQALPIAQVVVTANEIMYKNLHQTPYISSIALHSEPSHHLILLMRDNKRVTIIPKKINLLNSTDYKQLFEFFSTYPGIDIVADTLQPQSSSSHSDEHRLIPSSSTPRSLKQSYFDELMHHGTVDMIYVQRKFAGFFISDTIACKLHQLTTLIFHAKFALAKMPPTYKGLMKTLIWLRGFALSQQFPEYNHICYNEAASAHGFATVTGMKTFPMWSEGSDLIPELIKKVYPDGERTVMRSHGYFYMPNDPLVIHESPPPPSAYPNRARLFTEVYRTIQSRHPSTHIPMFFKPTRENLRALRQSLLPVMGPAFDSLAESYVSIVKTEHSKSPQARL